MTSRIGPCRTHNPLSSHQRVASVFRISIELRSSFLTPFGSQTLMSLYGYQFGSEPPTEEPDDGNVPGNSNEDTIPTGEDDGNDGDDSEEETPIGANEPGVFAHEVLDEIEEIIESFRDGSISKGVAMFNIIECNGTPPVYLTYFGLICHPLLSALYPLYLPIFTL
ncbi:hypothetical protein LshimejAT787_1900450 [Lyophyllum shimeji]|uniref:Uncharacterized protein n=1 Tax=Lyophyllum shimeji TaxID=47721 RepID=A0A9P3UUA6_LYOSH|nr:hypothetical protein LshimejAT787_1900450 [Lyophyllum shimeji]